MKKIKRRNLKPPGKCVFCGAGDLSHEHVFGDWLRHYFPRYENSKHTHGAITWPTDRSHEAPVVTKWPKQGHSGTKQVRVVCRTCNHGWMEEFLERATRPILEPMMLGRNLVLTLAMRTQLAIWATKVAMVSQYLPPRAVVTPQVDRTWLKDHLTPPDGWSIFAAAYDGTAWADLSLYQQRMTLDKAPIGDHDTPPYMAMTTVGLNRVILFVYSTSWNHGRRVFAAYDDIAMRRIWPVSDHDIAWPPLEVLSDADATKVANLFNIKPDHAFDPNAYRAIAIR
jgi:hypothetical protein